MNLNLDLNRAIRLYGLIILGFLLLLFLAKHLDLTDYYKFDYETNETTISTPAFLISTFIWLLPMAGFWFTLSTLSEDKRPGLAALGLYLIIEGYFSYLNYDRLNTSFFDYKEFSAYEYWRDFFIRSLPYVAYVLLRYKNDRRFYFLILFPFVSWGIHYIWAPGMFVERVDDFLRGIDFREGLGRYEPEGISRRYMYLMLLYSALYPVLFYMFTRLENYLQNPFKFKRDFNVIDPASMRLDKASFSIIFWCSRMVIAVIIFSNFEESHQSYMQETKLILAFKALVCCGVLYLFVVFYRNLLTLFCLENNHYPSWQFFGMNIPIINLIVWIVQISKPKQEISVSFLDDDMDGEENTNTLSIPNLKAEFLRSDRNKGIIGLVVTFTILSGIFWLWVASEGRSASDGIVSSLIALIISLGIIMWYYLKSSGAFYISASIAVLALSIFFLEVRVITPYMLIPSIVNIVLYHALYHFHEYEITTGDDDIPDYADTTSDGGIGADLEGEIV